MIKPMNIYHLSTYRGYLLSVLLITAIFTPWLVTAGIYKWTDENGNVHYGGQRPADATSERMKIKTGETPYGDETTAKDKKDKAKLKPGEKKEEKKAQASKPPEPPKISKKEKKRRCAEARQNLATIETRGRVRVKTEDGSSRHLTPKERDKRVATERKEVSKNCK